MGLVTASDDVLAQRARFQSQAAQKPKPKPEVLPQPQGELTVIVSLGSQKLSVYADTEQVARVSVSSGKRGNETPPGIYTIIQKNRIHFSNLYNEAPMPYMQRLTWSGIALHAGHLPGYPASHGCVRLPHAFAQRLFTMTRMGARVIVTHGDPSPSSFQHQRLAALVSTATTVAGAAVAGQQAAAAPGTPMFLGAVTLDSASLDKPAEGPANEAPATPGRSLLKQAQVAVAERTLALEAAKAARATAAQKHDDALHMLTEARDAQRVGTGEAGRGRSKVRSLEAQLDAVEARLKALGRGPGSTGEPAPGSPEERLEATLKTLTTELETARAEANEKDETLREISEELTAADRNRAAASLALEDASFRLKLAEEALLTARRDLVKRQQPVSLLFSRKTGKLYVRQGFEPLLESQASLDDPDRPVGTHVLTLQSAGETPRWTAVSVPADLGISARVAAPEARRLGTATRGRVVDDERSHRVVSVPGPITAAAALDRLHLPADVLEQLSGMLRPGSSLVITDQPLNRETGKGTDLIVSVN